MSPPAAERAYDDEQLNQPGRALLVLLCLIVLAFRFASWRSPSQFIVNPAPLLLPLNLLGVLHLACGVWAWCVNPSTLTRLFLVSAIGSAIHWGGSVGSASDGPAIAFLVFYAAVTVIGDAALFDLALRYPSVVPRRGLRAYGLYLVGGLTLVAVPIAPLLPRHLIVAGLGFVIGVAFALSIAAGVVFVIKLFRATAAQRREQRLTVIVLVLLATSVIDLVGEQGVLPGASEAWSLPYGLVPLTFAWALTRHGREPATSR